jgi:putative transposase
MPSRNVIKVDSPASFYHVYVNGLNNSPIYLGQDDFLAFLTFVSRYLSPSPQTDRQGRPYAHLATQVEVLAYVLMGNYFHLLLYQETPGGMAKLMRGLMTSYSQYFNRSHQRRGPLFETRYKAVRLGDEQLLPVLSKYIHLRPRDWRVYPYSSLQVYSGELIQEWLQSDRILRSFRNRDSYVAFVAEPTEPEQLAENLTPFLADR